MKSIKLFLALAGMALLTGTSHAQLSLNFSSTPGSTIQFNGAADSFQFNTSTSNNYVGSQFEIGSESGGTGSAIGLFGVVTNGPFYYGPITTTIPFAGATLQTANIGAGTNVQFGALAINDGLGKLLTGNVAWIQVDTFDYSGGINASLTVNVTDLAYAGSNPDLLTLLAGSPASMDLTFQFSPGMTLGQLSTGSGPYVTSYSGSISDTLTPAPEPASAGCLLLGLGTLIFTRRFRKN
jgi:hypothetical protein